MASAAQARPAASRRAVHSVLQRLPPCVSNQHGLTRGRSEHASLAIQSQPHASRTMHKSCCGAPPSVNIGVARCGSRSSVPTAHFTASTPGMQDPVGHTSHGVFSAIHVVQVQMVTQRRAVRAGRGCQPQAIKPRRGRTAGSEAGVELLPRLCHGLYTAHLGKVLEANVCAHQRLQLAAVSAHQTVDGAAPAGPARSRWSKQSRQNSTQDLPSRARLAARVQRALLPCQMSDLTMNGCT